MADEDRASDDGEPTAADTADESTDTIPDDVTLSGAWTRDQLVSFLDDATIPIRLGCRTPGDTLWMLSLWYVYRDGCLWCATAESADVVTHLRADPEVSFEISVNEPPYRGVRGRGSVTIEPDPEKELLRDLLVRYLGGTDSDLAQRLLSEDRQEVSLCIDPAKLYTWDYSDRMRDAT